MRKFISFLQIILLTLVSISTVSAQKATYIDVNPDSELGIYLNQFSDLHVIEGYYDGTFGVNKTINRAELLNVLYKLTFEQHEKYIYQTGNISEACFSDMTDFTLWYHTPICQAQKLGMVRGYPDGTFRPWTKVNAVEAYTLIFNYLGYQQYPTNPWYQRVNDIAESYDIYLAPDQEITRGEVALLLGRVINDESRPSYQFHIERPIDFETELSATSNVTPSSSVTIPSASTTNTETSSTSSAQPKTEYLEDILRRPPTSDEIAQINRDFNIYFDDTDNYKWPNDQSAWLFDQNSPEPSKMVFYTYMNVLKHMEFSKPLPFTSGINLYDYLKKYTKEIHISNQCSANLSNKNGTITLTRSLAVWDMGMYDNCFDYTGEDLRIMYYPHIATIIHENGHSTPEAQPHILCENKVMSDEYLHMNGGYSHEIIYAMWLYKYATNINPEYRQHYKDYAHAILTAWICDKSYFHPDPDVRAIVQELISSPEYKQ